MSITNHFLTNDLLFSDKDKDKWTPAMSDKFARMFMQHLTAFVNASYGTFGTFYYILFYSSLFFYSLLLFSFMNFSCSFSFSKQSTHSNLLTFFYFISSYFFLLRYRLHSRSNLFSIFTWSHSKYHTLWSNYH